MSSLDASTELLSLFADPTRVRLVALLSSGELSVAELTSVVGLAQSRVSTHLGKLRDEGVVVDRRDGASTFYSVNDGAMPAGARALWTLLSKSIDDAVLDGDRARREKVVAARGGRWPDVVAGHMEQHYSPGRTWESLARGFLGLLRLGDVLDVGCGDGAVAQLVAPRCKSVTCIDRSEKLLAAAKERLAGATNVKCALGDAHELPFDDARFDDVLLFNALTCVTTPTRVIAEAARVLRPKGRLVVTVLAAHDHAESTAAYHHLHAGFEPKKLKTMIERTGLVVDACSVTSRERRPPQFEVVTAVAIKESARESTKEKHR
jgi:ArsR family transcriptional regulator